MQKKNLQPGVPFFAHRLARDWLERNGARWTDLFRNVSEVEAVTLAEIRWPGLKESAFGVGLWLVEHGAAATPVRDLIERLETLLAVLPPSKKHLAIVEGEDLQALWAQVDDPIFMRHPEVFLKRLKSVQPGRVNIAHGPFERQ